MSEPTSLHALLGGTFDPIHFGHLCPVEALAKQVGLQQVTLLPNNVPPHRPQPEASPAQRLSMVERAIADRPLFTLDRREMQRQTPSWTVETLTELRKERGEAQPLAFIIGQDSLLTLHHWHRWQDLLSLCHLLVCRRPSYQTEMENAERQAWLDTHLTHHTEALHQQPAGLIFLADTPLIPISATDIRRRLHRGESCDDLLPPAVSEYIVHEGLYSKKFELHRGGK